MGMSGNWGCEEALDPRRVSVSRTIRGEVTYHDGASADKRAGSDGAAWCHTTADAQHGVFPDPDRSREPHAGAKMGVIPDHTVMIDRTASVEDAIGADPGTRIDDGSRHHHGAGPDGGTSGNNRTGMQGGQWGSPSAGQTFENRSTDLIVPDGDNELKPRRAHPDRIFGTQDGHTVQGLDSTVLIQECEDGHSRAAQCVKNDPRMASSAKNNRGKHSGQLSQQYWAIYQLIRREFSPLPRLGPGRRSPTRQPSPDPML